MSSPLKLGAISIKNQTRRNVDHATRNDFSGNIAPDVPLEDFITALFSVSKDDISTTKSRPWDTIDDDVSNYRRMIQQKSTEEKLYPYFQQILVKLGQEVTKEDLAFVVRVSGTDKLKDKYTSRKPDGSIWWGTVELVWHLMKAAIQMKRRKKSSHCDGGTQAQTMPDILYKTDTRNRGPEAGPSTLRISTIPEIPAPASYPSTPPPNAKTELLASLSTPPPNATTSLLPILSDASSNDAPLIVLDTPPVPSGPSEELNILPDPKKPRRLPTHKLLRPLEGDDYGANAAWKSNFKISKVSRRTLFAAVQPAFKPLVDTWLKPLLKLFTRAALDDTEDSSDSDLDSDTLGGILTFDNFMKAIGAVPREIPAEFKKDG
ncbi:hypothetical protein EYR40_003127 [Pleurotus pulmonarius]|nr:hypothetical protein EYR40_003127 [Pleurotus pulmonarius]